MKLGYFLWVIKPEVSRADQPHPVSIKPSPVQGHYWIGWDVDQEGLGPWGEGLMWKKALLHMWKWRYTEPTVWNAKALVSSSCWALVSLLIDFIGPPDSHSQLKILFEVAFIEVFASLLFPANCQDAVSIAVQTEFNCEIKYSTTSVACIQLAHRGARSLSSPQL